MQAYSSSIHTYISLTFLSSVHTNTKYMVIGSRPSNGVLHINLASYADSDNSNSPTGAPGGPRDRGGGGDNYTLSHTSHTN